MKPNKSKKAKPSTSQSSERQAQDCLILAFVPAGMSLVPIFGIIDFTGIYGDAKIANSKLKPLGGGSHRKLPAGHKSRRFKDYPLSARKRAMLRKQMLAEYFAARKAGKLKMQAENHARAEWTKATGQTLTPRTIRRWVAKIQSLGGMNSAPDKAFIDSKSSPHFRARKHGGPQK